MPFLNSLTITFQGQTYVFDGSTAVNIAPPVGSAQEIFQNVWNIFQVPHGSQCLLRDFGFDMSLIDQAGPRASQILQSVVARLVKRWEPRATVKLASLTTGGLNGVFNASFTITANVAANGQPNVPLISSGTPQQYTTVDINSNGQAAVLIEAMTV
jgi:phage baseplate assembly protein W